MRSQEIESICPLSPQQQGTLFETLALPESGVHVEQEVHPIRAALDPTCLQRAWQQVVDRHAMLRTAFVWKSQDQPLQVVLRQAAARIEQQDWRGLSAREQEERLEAYLQADRQRGFELTRPPLVRMAVMWTGDESGYFVRSFHHILMDGWCVPIVNRELVAFYQALAAGKELALPPAPQYREYVAWLKRQDLRAAERFWRERLRGFRRPTPLGREAELGAGITRCAGTRVLGAERQSLSTQNSAPSTQNPKPGVSASHGRTEAALPPSETAALAALCRRHRVTPNTLVQGVWAMLLSRYSGEGEVVFGTTVSGRPAELPGAESMLGLFTNTLPFRLRVEPGRSLWPWLQEVQAQHLELRSFDYCSAGQVQQWSELAGSAPLFESILVYENYPAETVVDEASGLRIAKLRQAHYVGAQTRYALALLVDLESDLLIRLVYDRRRLDDAAAEAITSQWLALLRAIAAAEEPLLGTLLDQIPLEEVPRVRPRPGLASELEERGAPAPATPVEAMLAAIWAGVLGVERVSVQESFYHLGGHSLLAGQIMSRVREAFQVELPLSCLFEHPTVAGLSRQIEAAQQAALGLQAPPISPAARNGDLPLSFAQQRLWFADQLAPGSAVYNGAAAVRLTGRLDTWALAASLNEIVRRHEALRTRFPVVAGRPVQRIAPALALDVPVIDLSETPLPRRAAEAERLTAEEAARPFDLAAGPVLRASLLRLAPEEHRLLLTLHHIVSDRWSLEVLFRELAALYEAFVDGRPSPLPQLPVQYADYAVWQRQWLQGEVLEQQLAYWRGQFGERVAPLALPPDPLAAGARRGRPSYRGAALPVVHSEEVSQAVQGLSRREGVTLFMTLLAAFKLLLHQCTGQTDILVGTNSAGRTAVELEGLIGFFINQLALRTDLSGDPTFRELLHRVRSTALGAYAHQALPFDKLVESLRPERDASHTPFFRVLFVQNAPIRSRQFAGLTMSPPGIDNSSSKFDLAVFMEETDEGLASTWVYKSDLFNAATIARMADQFDILLAGIADRPEARLTELAALLDGREREHKMVEKKEREQSQLMRFKNIRARPVSLAEGELVKTEPLRPGELLPLLVQPAVENVDLAEWARSNRELIESRLLKHGGLLFHGFGVDSLAGFEQFTLALCGELFGEYGDLPRAGVSGKIYTSTPYPEDQSILYHNESSHMHQWPLRIWFYCVQPAQQGGETPIVDCRRIYQELDPEIREPFAQKGVMYVRNFTDELDVSWESFFQTEDRSVVEEYCRNAGIQLEWKAGNGLRTRQVRQAVTRHPHSGEMLFFNQIMLHHVSCLDPAVRESLTSMFREEDLPRNVYYGDGTPIPDSVMAAVQEVYRQCTVTFTWQKGDIVMLDNMMVAHARNPYVGPRKIVVAMGEMFNGGGK